jgi:hypothetical protein
VILSLSYESLCCIVSGCAVVNYISCCHELQVFFFNDWYVIDRYHKIISDPNYYQYNESVGMSYVSGDQIGDLDGALERLVVSGDIKKSQLFVYGPNKREATKIWMSEKYDVEGPLIFASAEYHKNPPFVSVVEVWHKHDADSSLRSLQLRLWLAKYDN